MYEYKGERSVEKMQAFATGGWAEATAKASDLNEESLKAGEISFA